MPRKIKPRSPKSRNPEPGKQSKKRAASKPRDPAPVRTASPQPSSNRDADSWLYGRHPVFAALDNPRRRVHRLLATAGAAKSIPATSEHRHDQNLRAEIVARHDMDNLLPEGAVHQGLALLATPLPPVGLDDILRNAAPDAIVVVLDQVSDPHNVGAVLRSAAVFGAAAVILPARGAPPATGVLAKAASGALERIPLVSVGNLARALADMKRENFWCVGLDGDATEIIGAAPFDGRVALVLGAEGEGLRRLTRQNCDILATIPAVGPFATLNVSNAAAVALYEVIRRRMP